jgi:diguanylate cyclase (GGDEF)-like protein/PAS domain S-box-containing protein
MYQEQYVAPPENFYRSVFEHSMDAVFLTTPDGVVLTANPAACELFGRTEEEICKIGRQGLVDASSPKLAGFLEERARTGRARAELILIRGDGSRFPGEVSSEVFADDQQNIRTILIVRDISKYKQSEQLLAESEEQYRLLITAMEEGVTLQDENSAILAFNKSAERILGLTADQLRSKTSFDPDWYSIHEDGSPFPGETHPVVKTLKTGLPQSNVIMGIHKPNGELTWISVNVQPIFKEGKTTPHQVVATMHDITDHKKAEAELRIAATAFESQESMMITDANGVILRVNQAFTETTGYTAEEVVGQTPRMLKSGRHDANFYRAMWESIHRTGTWQGEIWDRRKNGEVYPKWLTISAVKGDDGVVTHYVGSHIDITERKVAEEKVQHLAFYDPLTDLPNRRLLMDRLQQALASSARRSRQGALLIIDLDNFKTLNDTLGHDVGDALLQQVAQRLLPCVREGDTVARLGGDEFVVVLENLSEYALEAAAQTEAIGEKILTTLNQLYKLGTAGHRTTGRWWRTTTSIGATLFIGHQSSIEELMKQADIAMYQAKKAGRNTLRFFDPQMQEVINDRVSLERELLKALEQQQFQLYYQIQMDSSHRPLGAEALVRWNHPERGLISPAQFIPLAEETGLILPIGQWVLETACAQIKAWERNEQTRDLVLAVNVSPREFRQAAFVAQLQAVIQRHGINPQLLKLELTESLLLEDMEETIATMNALNEIGVQFSLDDFGTGYSSLQYLKQLPLDQLKIDQSFVRDITTDTSDKEIVRTIIAMARSLNLDVIAEGVETEEQRQLLMESGCTRHQGYLFSKPVPIEQFETLLKQG